MRFAIAASINFYRLALQYDLRTCGAAGDLQVNVIDTRKLGAPRGA